MSFEFGYTTFFLLWPVFDLWPFLIQVILEDIALLGITYDKFSHTSDHFDYLLTCCEQLIRQGKAYVDDTEPELMKKEREERIESKNRSNGM